MKSLLTNGPGTITLTFGTIILLLGSLSTHAQTATDAMCGMPGRMPCPGSSTGTPGRTGSPPAPASQPKRVPLPKDNSEQINQMTVQIGDAIREAFRKPKKPLTSGGDSNSPDSEETEHGVRSRSDRSAEPLSPEQREATNRAALEIEEGFGSKENTTRFLQNNLPRHLYRDGCGSPKLHLTGDRMVLTYPRKECTWWGFSVPLKSLRPGLASDYNASGKITGPDPDGSGLPMISLYCERSEPCIDLYEGSLLFDRRNLHTIPLDQRVDRSLAERLGLAIRRLARIAAQD